MSDLIDQVVTAFKKGRDKAYAERGYRQNSRAAAAAEIDTAETRAGSDGEDSDKTSLVTRQTAMVKALKVERDEANKLLTELAAEAKAHKQRIEELEAECDEHKKQTKKLRGDNTTKTKLIEKLTATVKALKARAGELEAERDTLGAPLKIPGMKRVLAKVVHEDSHKDKGPLTDDQRRELTEWSQSVNAAFALLKRLEQANAAADSDV